VKAVIASPDVAVTGALGRWLFSRPEFAYLQGRNMVAGRYMFWIDRSDVTLD
jgi:hypothetical protein